jgi:hypothetical protein
MGDDIEKSQVAPKLLKQRTDRSPDGQVITSASETDPVTAKKVKKARNRLTAHEWNVRCLRVASAFPSSVTVNSKQALERIKEFEYAQNAYGFLKTAVKRKLAEDLGDGIFRFLPSAIEQLEKLVEETSAPVKPLQAPDAQPATVKKTASDSVASTVHSSSPPPFEPSKRTDAESVVTIVRPLGRPRGHRSQCRERDEIETLLQLSQRYRSNQIFKVDDLVVPWPECRDAIYGDADIGTGSPPFCVVVQTNERELDATRSDEIKVLFLDVKGQAHVATASSWRFMPYRHG